MASVGPPTVSKRRWVRWYVGILLLLAALGSVALTMWVRNWRREQAVISWLQRIPSENTWKDPRPAELKVMSVPEWIAEGKSIEGVEETLQKFMRADKEPIAKWVYKEQVVTALGAVGTADSVPLILGALKHPDLRTRVYAILSLGRLRDKRAVGPLCNIVRSVDEPNEKWNALYALGLIGDPEAIPVLEQLLRSELSENDRTAVSDALYEIRERQRSKTDK